MLTLPRGRKKALQQEVVVDSQLEAPLAVGDTVGTVTLSLDGEVVYEESLVALQAVQPGSFLSRLWDMVLMWINGLLRG